MNQSLQRIENIKFLIQENVTPDVSKTIELGLDNHEMSLFNVKARKSFILAYCENNSLAGGLRAVLKGKDYYIKHLWVDEVLRGNGLGAALMQRAEQEALEKDCKHIWVNTMSYQAPEFYNSLAYQEVACVKNYRDTYDRIFFKKDI